MSAKIIRFDGKPLETEPVHCSFCGIIIQSGVPAFSNGAESLHICPRCLVKCDSLMKEGEVDAN